MKKTLYFLTATACLGAADLAWSGDRPEEFSGAAASVKKAPTEAELQSLFAAFDKDGSGTIDKEELSTFFRVYLDARYEGEGSSMVDKAPFIMRSIDETRDAQLNLEEFQKVGKTILESGFTVEQVAREQALSALFRFFDKDASGSIENAEMKALFSSYLDARYEGRGEDMKAKIPFIIKSLDEDASATFSFYEFRKLGETMLKHGMTAEALASMSGGEAS